MFLLSAFFYTVFIRLFNFSIAVAALFNSKASQLYSGRKNTFLLLQKFNENYLTEKRIWFHCASLGEFEQARPLIELTKKNHPDYKVVITFFSPSGYEIRKDFPLADLVFYLPSDTLFNAKRFIKELHPTVSIWVKYEFWFHYLSELKKQNIPLILIAATFRENQIFFKFYGAFFREILSCFTKIFVQNTTSQILLSKINIPSEIASDTRFDRVLEISKNPKTWKSLNSFKSQKIKILVAGSTWIPDEKYLLTLINDNTFLDYKFIIAPHQIEKERLQQLYNSITKPKIYFSELKEKEASQYDVIILDNIGNLSSLYAYADVAYIGGGFGKSIHNVLEAAVYKIPVLTGPNFHKAVEAEDLIALGAAKCIHNSEEIRASLNQYLNDKSRLEAGKIAKEYILTKIGGTEKIYEYILGNQWM